MSNNKTVLEWLEQAKKDGYPWADAAINNAKSCVSAIPNIKSAPCDTIAFKLSEAVGSFYWKVTSEGHDFWDEIYFELVNEKL